MNQLNCEHIYGRLTGTCISGPDLIRTSMLHKIRNYLTLWNSSPTRKHLHLSDIFDGRNGFVVKYHYCPKCGLKLDWKVISKELTGKL